MVFAHDTEVALAAASALVNTANPDEGLPDVPALDRFVAHCGWTGRHEHADTELRSVRELRSRLRRLWDDDEDEVVATVNALLREARALPQLVRHDEQPWHLHATDPDAPLATRMAVEAAMAFADVVRMGELGRLRVCTFEDCGDVFVDLSKNRSKRFCDGSCSNRSAVNAYRARRRSGARIP
jgi:predicted RNA-binding Zn ribbon-like protein